jgi:hypothetical protein
MAGCLLTLTLASCGEAFTDAVYSGAPPGLDGSFDASVDTALPDVVTSDGTTPRDARGDAPGDALANEGGGHGDGSGPPPVPDGGALDASLCVKTCPSGFDCILGACVDRAAQHFGAATTSDNWSYGSFMNFGSTAFAPYAATWTTNGIVFASKTANVLALSVFHSITSAMYQGMTIPAGTLGLYPGSTTSADSVVRWTAPTAGSYSISATFTGLGTTPATTVGVSVNIGPVNEIGESIDRNTPSIDYTNAAQSMAGGDTIDFYVNFATLSDDEQGGTALDARITAN